MLLTPAGNGSVAIQAMSSGKFLGKEKILFEKSELSTDNHLTWRLGIGCIFFGKEGSELCATSDDWLKYSDSFKREHDWSLIFPGIPLLRSLSYEWHTKPTTMMRNRLPLNTPVHLKSYKGTYLEVAEDTGKARCLRGISTAKNQLVFHDEGEGTISIELRARGLFLSVHGNGKCTFTGEKIGEAEKFGVEVDENSNVFFISCFNGNTLQCDILSDAHCENKNKLEWEKWKVIMACDFCPALKPYEKVIEPSTYC